MTATVDALVVARNGRELLRECLASLQRCRLQPTSLTVSVFDNGSRDGAPEMVEAEFPGVRLVRSATNEGFARANNVLATSSTAEYLLLLNSDTILIEDIVTPLLAALTADRQIIIAAPRLEYPDGRPQFSAERFPTLRFEFARELHGTRLGTALERPCRLDEIRARTLRTDEIDCPGSRDVEFAWATCWLIRRADFIAAGLFDERFFTYDEDLDFCRRARDRGRRIIWVGATRLLHIGGASSTAAEKRRLVTSGRRRYYRRHHGRPAAVGYRAIVNGAAAGRALRRAARARRD